MFNWFLVLFSSVNTFWHQLLIWLLIGYKYILNYTIHFKTINNIIILKSSLFKILLFITFKFNFLFLQFAKVGNLLSFLSKSLSSFCSSINFLEQVLFGLFFGWLIINYLLILFWVILHLIWYYHSCLHSSFKQ